MAAWEHAGFPTDWARYPYQTAMLFRIWRQTERDVAEIRSMRLQAFIKAWCKQE